MIVVSNSSPLIFLAKIGKLNLLKQLFNEILIPKEVFSEVVIKGKEEGYSEVYIIEESVKEKSIRVIEEDFKNEINKIEKYFTELDYGEIEVLLLTKKVNADLILIDDATGRRVAESFGLNVKGTLYVILSALNKDLIDKKTTKHLLNKLISYGFRISSELYSIVLEEIEKH